MSRGCKFLPSNPRGVRHAVCRTGPRATRWRGLFLAPALALAGCATPYVPPDWNDRPLIDYDLHEIFRTPCTVQDAEQSPDGTIAIINKPCPPPAETPRRRKARA